MEERHVREEGRMKGRKKRKHTWRRTKALVLLMESLWKFSAVVSNTFWLIHPTISPTLNISLFEDGNAGAYSKTAMIKGMIKDFSFNLQARRAKYAWIGTVIIIAKRGYQLNPTYQLTATRSERSLQSIGKNWMSFS
jgi:hypothetical protein